ncbi:PP2C family protein-serine/threonine phosphatase [Agromyces allii]|uniref:Protein phosphatase 2C domain-containing protein n=1 Tax=Agromyces allii TaxID=393607 RepID=A0ABN2RDY0_9MICO|nr:protein phosphatase 2C domain-containing protein [Agromyces allii]
MTIKLDVVVATHRGLVRDHNEDAIGIAGWSIQGETPSIVDLLLDIDAPKELVIADGLGGHLAGEIASRVAVESFFSAEGTLEDRIGAADEALHGVGISDPRSFGLATTIAGVQVHPDRRMTVFNVGDSRVYRLVDGLFGMLSEDDRHQDGGVTQVLGGELRMVVEPHIFETDLADDILLICSDGLTTVLDDDAIAEVLALPLREAAAELVNRTLEAGAPDNVTLILCRMRHDER